MYIIFKDKKSKRSHKAVGIKVFLTFFLLGDRRIQKAQKHVDPYPDPQHCFPELLPPPLLLLGNLKVNFFVEEFGVTGDSCGDALNMSSTHRLSRSCMDLLASWLAMMMAFSRVRSSLALMGLT